LGANAEQLLTRDIALIDSGLNGMKRNIAESLNEIKFYRRDVDRMTA
jgi:hypothetical protein